MAIGRQKVKVLEIEQIGDGERKKSLVIVEDDSTKKPNRFGAGIVPKNFARVGEYISTSNVNYVKPHMEGIDKAREMYEKLRKESR